MNEKQYAKSYDKFNREWHLVDAGECPFCGNDYIKAELETRCHDGIILVAVSIRCYSCGVSMEFGSLLTQRTDHNDLLAEAVMKWNTRVN